jgi:hypothetical protein
MTILKQADAAFSVEEIHDPKVALANDEVYNRFIKLATQLRRVAPKAKDFIYFSAIILHAAEAALINQDTGEPVVGKNGKPVCAKWKINDKTGSWKWNCDDPNLKPYKNNNGDIFPEAELKKAYRKWVEKPLCKDHQSSSVDGVRGLIIDTYWDDKRKRVIALCALDKINFPDLARKVETGYTNNVSMGTAVGKSICFECGNVATTEAEYCPCVRDKRTYGEVNIDLSPIELSIVVTGADPRAKLRGVIASLNSYSKERHDRVEELKRAGCVTPGQLDKLKSEITYLKNQLNNIKVTKSAVDEESSRKIRNLLEVIKNPEVDEESKRLANEQLKSELGEDASIEDLSSVTSGTEDAFNVEGPGAESIDSNKEADDIMVDSPYGLSGNLAMTGGRGDFTQDPHSSGPPPWSLDGRESRLASGNLDAQIIEIKGRLDNMQNTLQKLAEGIQVKANTTTNKEDKSMSDARKNRAEARRAMFKKAYHFGGGGVNDPQTYPVDPGEAQARKQDKQMVGEGMEPGSDGLAGNDLAVKQKLSRAELEDRRLRRQAILSKGQEKVLVDPSTKEAYKMDASGKVQKLEQASAEDLANILPEPKDELGKKAYHQGGGGVNDPQTYPVDPGEAQARKQDKQMVGEGMEPGSDGLAGDDLSIKQRVLRANELSAKFIKVFTSADKKEIDKSRSRWEIYADKNKVLEATGDQIFGDQLEAYWDLLSSERYGRKVLSEMRKTGFDNVAYLLTGETGLVAEAQPPMPPPGLPGAGGPPEAGGAPPFPPPGGEEEGSDVSAEKVKDNVEESLVKVEQAIGDLSDILQEEGVVSGGKEQLPEIEEAGGEKEAAAKLHGHILEVRAALNDNGDELALLSETLEKRIEAGLTDAPETKELISIAQESISAGNELRSDAALIVNAKKKEEEENGKKDKKDDKKEDKKKEEKDDKKDDKKKEDKDDKKEDKDDKKDEKDEKDEKNGKVEASAMLRRILKDRAERRREMVRSAMEDEALDASDAQDASDASDAQDTSDVTFEEWAKEEVKEEEEDDASDVTFEEWAEGGAEAVDTDYVAYADEDPMIAELLSELEEGEGEGEDESYEDEIVVEEPAADQVSALASRKARREKIAAEIGSQYQLNLGPAADVDTDMLQRAHPKGGHTLEGLDTKVSENLDHFERIDEAKKVIMQQVKSVPKVREAVEHVADLLKKGTLTPSDFDNQETMKALAIDPEAAKYWKQYFGEGDQGSKQFGAELSKEFAKKKAAQDSETHRLKLRRAYDMALDMQDKGLIEEGRSGLENQVDDIMKFDDKAFEAFKSAVDRATKVAKLGSGKGANKALEVGLKSEAQEEEPTSLSSQLKNILW